MDSPDNGSRDKIVPFRRPIQTGTMIDDPLEELLREFEEHEEFLEEACVAQEEVSPTLLVGTSQLEKLRLLEEVLGRIRYYASEIEDYGPGHD